MRKMGLVMLVLLLVVPVLGNAGSVSSRYDVTFGGYVKYDLGWSSQNTHTDAPYAFRSSTANRSVLADEYGNTFASSGETRFNFLVKGPDLWGARTSAFIEGDFRGVNSGNQYGGFQLRHAYMKLNWSSAELLIGQAWQQWGMLYYPASVGFMDGTMYIKGIRTPQIAFRYFFTKELNAMIGVASPTNSMGAVRQYNDGYARSNWPGLQGEIAYWSDRCGKIGPHNLKFALGGYYGKDKEEYVDPANAANYKDDTINTWMTAFRYSIPIVPEKKGNKAMSVLLNGNFFVGQNPGGNNWLATATAGHYDRPDNSVTAPTLFGLWAQATWWLTDAVQFNGMYGYLKYNYSQWARSNDATARDKINMIQQYGANLLWDANQNIRIGVEWMRDFTGYNGVGAGTGTGNGYASRTGNIDQYRIGVWYFF
ncbi:MAG: hypothetical protein KA801_19355 [Syntrophorhabdaceae bacterium]|nr:hypothetical protein [Syntrophorhabdaceae bacterium]